MAGDETAGDPPSTEPDEQNASAAASPPAKSAVDPGAPPSQATPPAEAPPTKADPEQGDAANDPQDVVGLGETGVELSEEELAELEAEENAFTPHEALQSYSAVTSKLVEPTMTAAASVYVISREQLVRGGYRSVAEALAQVPGIFVSYDLINYHVAMRGALGGTRGGSRMLKVLIDGVPVPISQSETYLMGPEFIPMSAIERIEVMRGPASALYGAGALVGAINVVTKREAYDGTLGVHGDVRGMVGAPGVLAAGSDSTFALVGPGFHLLGGFSLGVEDRSGRSLAATSTADTSNGAYIPFVGATGPSPFLKRYAQKADDGTIILDSDGNPVARPSQFDYALPASLFLKGEANLLGGILRSIGLMQLQLRDAEFHDLAVLTGGNQMRFVNSRLMLSYERPLPYGFSAALRMVGGAAGTLPGQQIRFASPDVTVSEQAGSLNAETVAELRYDFDNGGFVQGGLDMYYAFERLPRYAEIDPETAQELLVTKDIGIAHIGTGAGFVNAGYPVLPFLKLTGGARLDLFGATRLQENSDPALVYWPAGAARAGSVLFLTNRLAWKTSVGASYKAPSPEQLFSARMTANSRDFDGDINVRPQYMFGGETSLEAFPLEWLSLSAAGFYNFYLNALSYVATGGVLRPTNYNAHNFGGEAVAQVHQDLPLDITAYAGGTLSLQYTYVLPTQIGPALIKEVPDNEGVPVGVGNLNMGLALRSIFTRLHFEYRYVSPRTPTQSNLLEAGSVDLENPKYVLADYHLISFVLGSLPVTVAGFGIDANLRVTNVLGAPLPYGAAQMRDPSQWDYGLWVPARPYSEVGFNGVDIPGEGMTAWMQLRLTF